MDPVPTMDSPHAYMPEPQHAANGSCFAASWSADEMHILPVDSLFDRPAKSPALRAGSRDDVSLAHDCDNVLRIHPIDPADEFLAHSVFGELNDGFSEQEYNPLQHNTPPGSSSPQPPHPAHRTARPATATLAPCPLPSAGQTGLLSDVLKRSLTKHAQSENDSMRSQQANRQDCYPGTSTGATVQCVSQQQQLRKSGRAPKPREFADNVCGEVVDALLLGPPSPPAFSSVQNQSYKRVPSKQVAPSRCQQGASGQKLRVSSMQVQAKRCKKAYTPEGYMERLKQYILHNFRVDRDWSNWRCEVIWRKDDSNACDPYWISPCGKRLRSLVNVARFLGIERPGQPLGPMADQGRKKKKRSACQLDPFWTPRKPRTGGSVVAHAASSGYCKKPRSPGNGQVHVAGPTEPHTGAWLAAGASPQAQVFIPGGFNASFQTLPAEEHVDTECPPLFPVTTSPDAAHDWYSSPDYSGERFHSPELDYALPSAPFEIVPFSTGSLARLQDQQNAEPLGLNDLRDHPTENDAPMNYT